MNVEAALAAVRTHGIVLGSARGPFLKLTEVIAGEPITGTWWAHPEGRRIFAVLRELADSPEILCCRLVDGKVTYVHRRLWPALVRLADRFERARLAQVHEVHTPTGFHVRSDKAFPEWVPADVMEAAQTLTEEEAATVLYALLRPAR